MGVELVVRTPRPPPCDGFVLDWRARWRGRQSSVARVDYRDLPGVAGRSDIADGGRILGRRDTSGRATPLATARTARANWNADAVGSTPARSSTTNAVPP